MSSISLSLILFAFYFYFPLLSFKIGASYKVPLLKTTPDRDRYLSYFFIISFVVTIVLYFIFKIVYKDPVQWNLVNLAFIPSIIPPTIPVDLSLTFKNFFFLICSYLLNCLLGYFFGGTIVPRTHLCPWKLVSIVNDNFSKPPPGLKIETRVDVLTKSGMMYSGVLERFETDKDDKLDFISIIRPSKKIKSELEGQDSKFEPIPTYKFIINNNDVSNINVRHFVINSKGEALEMLLMSLSDN